MRTNKPQYLLACLAAALSLAGCGGGNSSATVGGSVSGLPYGLSLVLQDNLGDSLTLSGNSTSSNQSFTFATKISSGGGYAVTVLTQPVGQTCALSNASGNVDAYGDNVSNVGVTCTTTASVGVTVAGLTPGTSVTLQSNGAQLLLGNGLAAFPGTLTPGTAYNVTVVTQPVGLTCLIPSPTGLVVANVMANVLVNCS